MADTVIETPRLRLRPHRASDYAAALALWQEPDVFRHITGQPIGAEDQWHRVMRFIGHWTAFGYGMFLVEDKATGQMLGEIGLADFHRGLGPDFDGAPEAAWVLGPWAHGQGIAREGMEAVLAWAHARMGAVRIVSMITPLNEASVGLARRLGFEAVRTASYRERPIITFERTLG
ncbi:GNAT family N-acetyltransferase [Sphingomonas naphthae]|uniref:GNAT family N-acetyltransferase n=1 Tax=Sphingomonas naphthae TaxID=1813468 RepID=A0ABY7TMX2_9SPHN|nr:GNAT family N-acetyltransferase [Sphingomonas naphthae]WCT74583.1 GNAT family N-acetyltransferase [Sphingomonas naphthae]